MESSDLMLS
jgi:hypothetical protein